MKASIMHLKIVKLSSYFGVLCAFGCRFAHFRPPVMLLVSCLFCRLRCRLVSSWYSVSVVNHKNFVVHYFELKVRQKCCRHLTKPALAPLWWLCSFTQGPKLVVCLHHETHMPLTIPWSESTSSHIGKQVHESYYAYPQYQDFFYSNLHLQRLYFKKLIIKIQTFSFHVLYKFYLIFCAFPAKITLLPWWGWGVGCVGAVHKTVWLQGRNVAYSVPNTHV